MIRPMLIACAAALLAIEAQAAECVRADQNDQIAEGRLAAGSFQDAAGHRESAYILQLPVPTCLSGAEPQDNVKRASSIHIYSSDPAIQRSIRRHVGKTVLVRGSAFGAITAHHHAPIVMNITEIDTQ